MRVSLLAAVVLLAGLGGCGQSARPPVIPADDARRITTSGPIDGFVNAEGGLSWLGLPYARPPMGALRWRKPQPVVPWTETRAALGAGLACIQYGWQNGGVGKNGSRQGSEDCLYLNVHSPRLDPAAARSTRLPVMFWIHGGSNTVGQGASYDGSRLAVAGQVVVVTINYRLGPFGWFIMPRGRDQGAAADPLEVSGNFGILDILAALQWVHDNAAAFGGDPDNVTVFGESAGATDALALMVSPLSGGLMQRLIVQSLGFGFAAPERASHYVDDAVPGTPYSSAEILAKLLVTAGRAPDRDAAKALAANLSPADIAEFLRGIAPWDFYAAYHPSNIETDLFPTVFQDGAVVRQGAVDELLGDPARHLAIPAIFGTNRDEPKLFMAFDPRLTRQYLGLLAFVRDHAAYAREAEYRSLLWKARGVDALARALGRAGSPVYAYRFDWRDEGTYLHLMDLTELIGAAHGLEIPFVFGRFTSPGADQLFSPATAVSRRALSDAMMSYWVEFATHGRPARGARGTLPEWPSWTSADAPPTVMVFDADTRGGIRPEATETSREAVLDLMEAREPASRAGCDIFRATFRDRVDPWADAAWLRYKDGYCRTLPDGATRRVN